MFPAALLGAALLGRRLRALGERASVVVLLVLVVVASFSLCWAASTGRTAALVGSDRSAHLAFYASPARAWEFAAGSLLALAAPRLVALRSRTSTAMAIVGGVLVLWGAVRFDDTTRFPGAAALLPVCGTALLIAAGESRAGNPVNRSLSIAPAQFVGDVSYGWYLWHWPLIVFATALVPRHPWVAWVGAALSLPVAWLSYRLVEQPIRVRQAETWRTLRLAGACLLVPLLAVGVAFAVRRQVADGTDMPPLPHHLDVTQGCSNARPLGDPGRPDCTWEAAGEDDRGAAILVGDSNAGQFSEAFVAAATGSGHDATIATYAACPFVDLVVVDAGELRPGCQGFVDGTLRELVARRPAVAVVSSASSWYLEDARFTFVDPATGTSHGDAASKAEVWRDGLDRVVEALEEAGIDVVIVHPGPTFDGFDPTRCASIWWMLDPGRCGTSIDRSAAERHRERSVAAEDAVARQEAAITVDPMPVLCSTEACPTNVGDGWLWRDMRHVTVDASRLLTGRLRAAMSPG